MVAMLKYQDQCAFSQNYSNVLALFFSDQKTTTNIANIKQKLTLRGQQLENLHKKRIRGMIQRFSTVLLGNLFIRAPKEMQNQFSLSLLV